MPKTKIALMQSFKIKLNTRLNQFKNFLLKGRPDGPQLLEWRVDDKYFNKITDGEAKFLFEHTEKQLKDTLDAGAVLTTKSTTLITVTVAVLIALFGFGVNRWDKIQAFDYFLISSLIGCCYLFLIAIILTSLILPKYYYGLGSDPEDFFSERFFLNEIVPEKDRQKDFYINEIEQYNYRITKNKNTNDIRGLWYKIALYLIIFSPLVFVTTYLILIKINSI